jgi:hypothetical protein
MDINTNSANFLYRSQHDGDTSACVRLIIAPMRIITALLITIYTLVVIGTVFNKIHSSDNEWGEYASIAVIIYNLITGFVFVGVSIADFIVSHQLFIIKIMM